MFFGGLLQYNPSDEPPPSAMELGIPPDTSKLPTAGDSEVGESS